MKKKLIAGIVALSVMLVALVGVVIWMELSDKWETPAGTQPNPTDAADDNGQTGPKQTQPTAGNMETAPTEGETDSTDGVTVPTEEPTTEATTGPVETPTTEATEAPSSDAEKEPIFQTEDPDEHQTPELTFPATETQPVPTETRDNTGTEQNPDNNATPELEF